MDTGRERLRCNLYRLKYFRTVPVQVALVCSCLPHEGASAGDIVDFALTRLAARLLAR